MLITEDMRTALYAGSLVVAIGAGIFAARGFLQRRRIPEARIATSSAGRIFRWIPVVILLAGIAGFYVATGYRIKVLVISDGTSKYGKRTLEYKLARSLPYPRADGDVEDKPLGACWTINLSSAPIRKVDIEYPNNPRGHFTEKTSITIEPGQRAGECDPDYYGVDLFKPPKSISEMAHARFNFASWLTWDEDEDED